MSESVGSIVEHCNAIVEESKRLMECCGHHSHGSHKAGIAELVLNDLDVKGEEFSDAHFLATVASMGAEMTLLAVKQTLRRHPDEGHWRSVKEVRKVVEADVRKGEPAERVLALAAAHIRDGSVTTQYELSDFIQFFLKAREMWPAGLYIVQPDGEEWICSWPFDAAGVLLESFKDFLDENSQKAGSYLAARELARSVPIDAEAWQVQVIPAAGGYEGMKHIGHRLSGNKRDGCQLCERGL